MEGVMGNGRGKVRTRVWSFIVLCDALEVSLKLHCGPCLYIRLCTRVLYALSDLAQGAMTRAAGVTHTFWLRFSIVLCHGRDVSASRSKIRGSVMLRCRSRCGERLFNRSSNALGSRDTRRVARLSCTSLRRHCDPVSAIPSTSCLPYAS